MNGDWLAARSLVLQYGWNAVGYQILNPGIRHWFNASGDAVIGYAKWANVRVVAGAPVCSPDQLQSAADAFEADSHAAGERVLFLCAGARMEEYYSRRRDHTLLSVGAQPVWDPRDWPAIVRKKQSLRAQLHRARNKGVAVSEWLPQRVGTSTELRDVLAEWLATRGLPPLHFLTTPDLLGNPQDRRVFVAERNGAVIGYLVATPIPARRGWLIEQWPRRPHAPNGTTHLLVHTAMSALSVADAEYATLGIAPLSDTGAHFAAEPSWLRYSLQWMRAHGRRFYNFRGLEAFKASLQPAAWEPLFAIADADRFTLQHLHAVAGVFSGGSPARFLAKAVGMAAESELTRMWN